MNPIMYLKSEIFFIFRTGWSKFQPIQKKKALKYKEILKLINNFKYKLIKILKFL
jgi:hypothetical protein